MGAIHWILDEENEPVALEDDQVVDWARWMSANQERRRVALDVLMGKDGPTTVSTVFLGIDYGFGQGPPVLWETAVFGPRKTDIVDRYTSWDDAKVGHAMAVIGVRKHESAGEVGDGASGDG